MRLLFALTFAILSCSGETRRGDSTTATGQSTQASASLPAAALAGTEASVFDEARAACMLGDTLLRKLPGTVLDVRPDVPFDSLWPGPVRRMACRVVAAGHQPRNYASVDSLIAWLKARGWSNQVTFSADGPDGTVQGVRRRSVSCLVEGRWDGGDDSDTTYVPTDTIEVHFSCTRLIAADSIVAS